MSSIWNSVVSAGKSALEKIQSGSDPNTVKSINPADFAPVPVQVFDYRKVFQFETLEWMYLLFDFWLALSAQPSEPIEDDSSRFAMKFAPTLPWDS